MHKSESGKHWTGDIVVQVPSTLCDTARQGYSQGCLLVKTQCPRWRQEAFDPQEVEGGEHLQPRSQCWERGREQPQPEADRLNASAGGQVQRWHAGMRRLGQDKVDDRSAMN